MEKPPRETLPAAALTLDGPDPKASGSSGSPSLTLASQGEEDSPFVTGRKRNWARLIKKTWIADPELCPSCHQPMKVLAAISSPGEDEVIEKILKARGQWAPPWKQPRPARGPPLHDHSTCPLREEEPLEGTEMIDPQRDVDEYCVDPPSPEDF